MSAGLDWRICCPSFQGARAILRKQGQWGLQADCGSQGGGSRTRTPLCFLFISLRGHPWASQEVEAAESCF